MPFGLLDFRPAAAGIPVALFSPNKSEGNRMEKIKKIEDAMTSYPSIASKKMSVTEAYEFMLKCKIRHLPVVEEGKVIGVVSDRDLRLVQVIADSMTLLVADVMAIDPYCVKVGTPLSSVAKEMAQKK